MIRYDTCSYIQVITIYSIHHFIHKHIYIFFLELIVGIQRKEEEEEE